MSAQQQLKKTRISEIISTVDRCVQRYIKTSGFYQQFGDPLIYSLDTQQLQPKRYHQDAEPQHPQTVHPNSSSKQSNMHAFSILLTTMAITATALAGPALQARDCPVGPYKEGSSCSQECEGAHKCSLNLYDVVRSPETITP